MTAPQPDPASDSSPSVDASLSRATPPPTDAGMAMLRNVEVELTLEIGRRRMRIADVLKVAIGQTLELGKAAGDPLDIFVNGRLLGRGEAVVLGDRYGVRITEILSPSPDGAP